MISILAALALSQSTSSVADYFPLQPGTKWDCQETAGMMSFTTRHVVGDPVEIDGKQATPIISTHQGKEFVRTYYRIEGDSVLIVAYDAKKPLGSPTPILKLGKGSVKWEFTGDSVMIHEPIGISMKGESSTPKKRSVLGQETEAIEVRLNGILGSDAGTAVKTNQVAYYAKGIGLVEMQSESTVGKTKSKTSLKLVRFEPPK
jgi:hypothetical protein